MQPFPDQTVQVEGRHPLVVFHEFAGTAVHEGDLSLFVHHHSGRHVVLQQKSGHPFFETAFGAARRACINHVLGVFPRGPTRGKLHRGTVADVDFAPPEQVEFLVQGDEQIVELSQTFGRSQEKNAARVEHVMEERNQFFLRGRFQINEQIPAHQQIQLCEGRVLEHILDREHDPVAHLLAYRIAVLVLPEIPRQPLPTDLPHGGLGVDALAPPIQGDRIDVRGENLVFHPRIRIPETVIQQDGHGIHLFSAGAAGRPHPKRVAVLHLSDQTGQHVFLQMGERLGVAKKTRHADEQFLQQCVQLFGVLTKIQDIFFARCRFAHGHPPLDAADQRIFFVLGKIAVRVPLEQSKNGRHLLLRDKVAARLSVPDAHFGERGEILPQRLEHPLRREHLVRQPGMQGAFRHARVLGRFRLLHQNQTVLFLDRGQRPGAVRARSGQHHHGHPLTILLGQRSEQPVDGQVQPALGRLPRYCSDLVVLHHHVPARGMKEDMPRRKGFRIPDLAHGKIGPLLQQVGKHGNLILPGVRDHHKGHPAIRRDRPEEGLQRLQPPGRSSHAHHRKPLFGFGFRRSRTLVHQWLRTCFVWM